MQDINANGQVTQLAYFPSPLISIYIKEIRFVFNVTKIGVGNLDFDLMRS